MFLSGCIIFILCEYYEDLWFGVLFKWWFSFYGKFYLEKDIFLELRGILVF